jgi:hypothetical protein
MHRSRPIIFITTIAVVVSLFPVLSAQAQQAAPRLSLDFSDASLKDVLQAVCKAGNLPALQLPEGAGDKRITVSLVDNTPTEALTVILDRANLTLVNDGGTTTIKEKATTVAAGARPNQSTIAQATSDILRQPPTAVRIDNTPLDVGRGTSTTMPGMPGTTALGTAAGQAKTAANADKVYRIIATNFMNVEMLSDMLGGSYVSEDNYRNSINGGGLNGNNNNNNGNNNNGFGNNNGNTNNTTNRNTTSTNRSTGF